MKKTISYLITTASLLIKTITPVFANDPIGQLQTPAQIPSSPSDVGPFLSNVIRLIVVLAGIWTLFQFLLAGFSYITGAGDQKKTQEAMNKIQHAIIGMVIIAVSFLLSGVIGLIFFNNATFILNPSIKTQ